MKNTLQTLQKKRKSKKGFTLMEMLIVVAIIAIFVAIAIPTFNTQLNNARLATDKANLRSAYAEASVDYLTDGDIDHDTITYGDFIATVTESGGVITVKATAGLQYPSSGADKVNTYSDGKYTYVS